MQVSQALRAAAVVLTSVATTVWAADVVLFLTGRQWLFALGAGLLGFVCAGATWLGFRAWRDHSPRHRQR